MRRRKEVCRVLGAVLALSSHPGAGSQHFWAETHLVKQINPERMGSGRSLKHRAKSLQQNGKTCSSDSWQQGQAFPLLTAVNP